LHYVNIALVLILRSPRTGGAGVKAGVAIGPFDWLDKRGLLRFVPDLVTLWVLLWTDWRERGGEKENLSGYINGRKKVLHLCRVSIT